MWENSEGDTKFFHAMKLVQPNDLDNIVYLNAILKKYYS